MHKSIAEKFVGMVYDYAIELQSDKNKYVMEYICELVKSSCQRNLFTLDDLYDKKEEDICTIFDENISSWKHFINATSIVRSDIKPENRFYISFKTKKRNVIPLVSTASGPRRIAEISKTAKRYYDEIEKYEDALYAYVEEIVNL